MRNFILVLLFLPIGVWAQGEGIQFVEGINWEQLKTKAKQENKYILMDCYTSWCGPCKVMENTVFTDAIIGTLANEKFLSIQVQFDEDKNADQLKKEWLSQSEVFIKEYNITGYPSILFFSPNGELVHKAVGMIGVPAFADVLNNVTNQDKQFYPLLKKHEADPEDVAILRLLIYAAHQADENPQKYAEEFFKLSPEIKSELDAQLLVAVTTGSKSIGFPILMQHKEIVNKYLGVGKAEERIRSIIFYEFAEGKLGRRSPMGYYLLSTNPDWEPIVNPIKEQFPEMADELIDYIKLEFFQKGYLWDQFQPVLESFMNSYAATVSDKKKKEYAKSVARYINDEKALIETLIWASPILTGSKDQGDQFTFGLLLYKAGKLKEAKVLFDKAMLDATKEEKKEMTTWIDKIQMERN